MGGQKERETERKKERGGRGGGKWGDRRRDEDKNGWGEERRESKIWGNCRRREGKSKMERGEVSERGCVCTCLCVCVGVGGGQWRGAAFCKAVARTYCALMGWLSFLLPFFFAVEEQY